METVLVTPSSSLKEASSSTPPPPPPLLFPPLLSPGARELKLCISVTVMKMGGARVEKKIMGVPLKKKNGTKTRAVNQQEVFV